MNRHCLFSPSASPRWLACPASLTLPERAPEPESDYASEGTQAHLLASHSLRHCIPAAAAASLLPGDPGEEMISAVDVFVEAVTSEERRLDSAARSEVFMQYRGGDFGGTADAVVPGAEEISILDLKYGAGKIVEVQRNPQLLCYALLALDSEGAVNSQHPRTPRVKLTVVQPRRHHPDGPVRSWEPTAAELQDFSDRVDDARETVATSNGSTPFHAGGHCTYCPHLAHCPEMRAQALSWDAGEFGALSAAEQSQRATDLEPGDMAEIMEYAAGFRAFLRAVERAAREMLEAGGDVPRHKLVARRSRRTYTVSEAELLAGLRNRGVRKRDAIATELKSPAQIEKLLSPRHLTWLRERLTRSITGAVCVPDSDRRPQLGARPTAADDFRGLTEESET